MGAGGSLTIGLPLFQAPRVRHRTELSPCCTLSGVVLTTVDGPGALVAHEIFISHHAFELRDRLFFLDSNLHGASAPALPLKCDERYG